MAGNISEVTDESWHKGVAEM